MSDLAELITAIGGLVGTIGGTFVLVWTALKPRRGADQPDAAIAVVKELAAAAADGVITAEELDAAVKRAQGEGSDTL